MEILNQELINSIANAIMASNVPQPTDEEILEQKKIDERSWRDDEIKRTDALAVLPDFPYSEQILVYRQELRDYPQQEDFPNGTRPIKP